MFRVSSRAKRCELSRLRYHATGFQTSSSTKIILSAALVDTFYRTSTMFFLTIPTPSLYVNLSSALHSVSLIQTLECGPTVGSPRSFSAPPSIGRGSQPRETVADIVNREILGHRVATTIGKFRKTLWPLSQAVIHFVRNAIYASSIDIFILLCLSELRHFDDLKMTTCHHHVLAKAEICRCHENEHVKCVRESQMLEFIQKYSKAVVARFEFFVRECPNSCGMQFKTLTAYTSLRILFK